MTTPDGTSEASPGRILGIGGIFFKSAGHQALRSWYQEKLGIVNGEHGAMFPWRSAATPDDENLTVWTIFPAASTYFNGSLMINYIVDDLDAFLAKCATGGVRIEAKPEDSDYGRFAWIHDPDGNKIELWEPPKTAKGADPAA